MPIDFSNVNVSLAQFQAVSSGTYNAGEIRLTGQSSLGKVNNHVSKTEKNVVSLSHEEVLAVKQAFVKALREGGVAADEIARVRAQLGLAPAPGGAVDRTLGERSLKPLTRQQVREILDRNAAAINGHAPGGAPIVRTSAELTAGLSGPELQRRRTNRDVVNMTLADHRQVAENRDVTLLGRLVAGDFAGLGEDDRARMLEIARDRLAKLRGTMAQNQQAGTLIVRWRLESGQRVELSTGTDAAGFEARLEDAVFRLTYERDDDAGAEMSPERWNAGLAKALSSAEEKPLPHDVRAMADELVAGARAVFGEALVPPGARLPSILNASAIYERVNGAAGEGRLSAADLRPALSALLRETLVRTAVQKRFSQLAGHEVSLSDIYADAFLRGAPGLAAALRTAQSAQDVAKAFADAAPQVEKGLLLAEAATSCRDRVKEFLADSVAAKTGVPRSVYLRAIRDDHLSFDGFELSCDLLSGKTAAASPEDVERLFRAEADQFAAGRAALLAQVDALNLPPESADQLKAKILAKQEIDPKLFDFTKLKAVAKTIEPAIRALETALERPDLADAEGLAAVTAFNAAVRDAVGAAFPGVVGNDPDVLINLVNSTFKFAIAPDSPVPALSHAFFSRPAVHQMGRINQNVAEFRLFVSHMAPNPADNPALAPALGTDALPPFHAKALVDAARAAGLTAIAEDEALALFRGDRPAGQALAEAVAESPVAVTPTVLRGLAAGVLRRFAGSIREGRADPALAAPEAGQLPEFRAAAASLYATHAAEPWRVDALAVAAIRACGDDADLRRIVLADFSLIAVAGNARLRTAESVRARVEALRANFAELRALAAEDQELYAQGRELIRSLHGKALPAGAIGRLVQAAWEQPIGALKKLAARSKGIDIHNAVAQYVASVNRALVEAGVEDFADGADELVACQNFVAHRFFSRLPRADLEGLRAALASPNGGLLLAEYNAYHYGNPPQGFPAELVRANRTVCAELARKMGMLHFAVCETLGVEPAGLQEAPERAELRRWGARDLPDDLVRLAREKAAADRAEAIRTYVRGTGPAADALRGLVGEKIDGLEGDPVETMRDTYQNIARTMINRAAMQDMKSLATGGQTQFGLDIARGFDVELNGVGKVSRDFATACDQFARFVTRNPNATYAGLDARTRRKAHLAMSLVQQGVPNAGALGFGVLLSPDLNRNLLAIGNGRAQFTFSLEFDVNGNLALRFRGVQNPGAIGIGGDLHPCAPGSTVAFSIDVLVPELEVERIAELDASQYDDGPVAQILDVQQPPRMHSQARFHGFAQPFRLQADVGVTFAADLR